MDQKKNTHLEIMHGFGSEAKLVEHRKGAFSAASDGHRKKERRDGGRGRRPQGVQCGALHTNGEETVLGKRPAYSLP